MTQLPRKAAAFVVALNVSQMTFAQPLPAHPSESIPAGEAAAIQKTASILKQTLMKEHQPGQLMRRDAHAKHHGCVDARFEVLSNLPADRTIGVFQPSASYDAVIRFSNGSGRSQDDNEGDGRGMAVKLYGIQGAKILPAERNATTQDFLMINHPQFFVRNASDYVELSEAIAGGDPKAFFFPSVFPHKWRVSELKIANAVRTKVTSNLLGTSYFSMTPYQFGKNAVVKYRARPCDPSKKLSADMTSPNFLRDNMRKTLSSNDVCFVFEIQKQIDPQSQPVEDPTVLWDEHVAPFVPVAKITIPAQTFERPEREDYCENLSMTPWHSLPEHRPLGGINRVRRVVYEEISKLRHEINGAERVEP